MLGINIFFVIVYPLVFGIVPETAGSEDRFDPGSYLVRAWGLTLLSPMADCHRSRARTAQTRTDWLAATTSSPAPGYHHYDHRSSRWSLLAGVRWGEERLTNLLTSSLKIRVSEYPAYEASSFLLARFLRLSLSVLPPVPQRTCRQKVHHTKSEI